MTLAQLRYVITVSQVGTLSEGLNDFQVKKHIAKYGKNELIEKKKDSPLVIFLKQFQDLLVIILIFAAIVSGLSHQIESTFVIITVIVLNALLGTIQTLKSEKSPAINN